MDHGIGATVCGKQMCQQLNQLAKRAQTKPYLISAHKQGENENYEIAQYSAKSLKEALHRSVI